MYALHIEVANHTCGSLGIIVCSDSLDIWDTTKGPKPPESGQKEPAVISIGQQQAAQGSLPQSLHHVNSLHLAKLDEGSVGRQKVHTKPMLIYNMTRLPRQCQCTIQYDSLFLPVLCMLKEESCMQESGQLAPTRLKRLSSLKWAAPSQQHPGGEQVDGHKASPVAVQPRLLIHNLPS